MKRLLLLMAAFALLLSGCVDYSVSEDELNQGLTKQLADPITHKLNVSQGDEVIELSLSVSAVDLSLTSKDGGLIQVTLDSQLTGSLTLFSRVFALTSQLKPIMEAGVRLEEDRLYLVGPRIVNLEVRGASFQDQMLSSVIDSLEGDIEQVLQTYFNQNAIYQLDHSLLERFVAKFASEISVKQDNLTISAF